MLWKIARSYWADPCGWVKKVKWALNYLSLNNESFCSTDNCTLIKHCTGELGYDRLNGTRKIGPSYAKSVVYIRQILDMHRTGTKHFVRHMQKSVVQWSVISKFTCIWNNGAPLYHHRRVPPPKIFNISNYSINGFNFKETHSQFM